MKIHKKIIEEKVSVIKFTEEEVESLKIKTQLELFNNRRKWKNIINSIFNC
jgi:hypothetical protein